VEGQGTTFTFTFPAPWGPPSTRLRHRAPPRETRAPWQAVVVLSPWPRPFRVESRRARAPCGDVVPPVALARPLSPQNSRC